MGGSFRIVQLLLGTGLLACGAVGVAAWTHGLWGLLTGALLVGGWLIVINAWVATYPHLPARPPPPGPAAADAMVLRVLLDSAPTPLLGVDAHTVRALNRAARTLFATDDRVLPPPPPLTDRRATHLRHEGRGWRIDRVDVADAGRVVVALIDIEQEERTAEARATAELIQVLGHELLNGLAPIVSLAESGLAAAQAPERHGALLPEILGTLARRAEGLQRFTEAYRAMARLPAPMLRPVAIGELAGDLSRLFAGRWPSIRLSIDVADDLSTMLDRDQIAQALWAILQNAAEAAAGGGDGHVSLVALDEGDTLAITIRDSGAGVPPDQAERIFRAFHTTKAEGTGIGLSLARQIMRAHGGTLTLADTRPATFRLALPHRR